MRIANCVDGEIVTRASRVSDAASHVRRQQRSCECDDAPRDDNNCATIAAAGNFNKQPAITYIRDLYRLKNGKA